MQEKKRYILVKFEGAEKLSKETAGKAVSDALIEGVGTMGAAKAKAYLKEFDEGAQVGVVKCQTEMLGEVRACLALKVTLGGKPFAIRTQNTSGVIGKLWKVKRAK